MKRRTSGERKPSDKLARQERADTETSLRKTIRAILLALFLWAAWSATYILYTSPDHVTVVLGEPSPRDIKAPHQVTYISEVKTEEARLAAASQIEDVYIGPDMEIARQQLHTLQNVTEYISAIRYDQFADKERKLELLREIPSPSLSPSILSKILGLTEDDWQGVITETLRVLDLVMREEIRSNQLVDARRRAQLFTTRTLSDEQQDVVMALVQSMILPNSILDAEQTIANRKIAGNAVEPVHWTIRQGESILREGEIVTDLALEKLQILDLLDSDIDWQKVVGTVLLCLAAVVALGLYIARSHPLLLSRPRREILLVLTLVASGAASHIAIPGHTLIPYLFPTAAAAMVVAILLDVQLAIVVSGIMAIMVGFDSGGSIELVVYSLVGSIIGGLTIWRMDQLGAFFRAIVYIALANVAVILGFRLRTHTYDAVGLLQLLGAGVLNAVLSSSLTFVAFSFVGRIFGIATSLQLLELARPTQPLFRQLLIKAPGTYHHSIVISNMAERAAEAIGADALLARVGSYYHDVGKIPRPYFFAENQSDGDNPHDKLDPKTSAEIVISHVSDGIELARKYRLPSRVCAFIPEHHGTTLASYFFRRATNESDGQDVREDDFRYPGPRPQSRETAIVMLADGIEAWVRANSPSTQAEMERVIRRVINDRLLSGQLDECDLTFKDLDSIRKAFVDILQGIFHPRIQYPEKVSRRNNRETNGPPK